MDQYDKNAAKNWVEYILHAAIDGRASDIHFEPEQGTYKVRYRVDGLLYPLPEMSGFLKEPISATSSRIKVLAQMDITEHRIPQDGHFEIQHRGMTYNIRVSSFPTTNGETIVLRIHNWSEVLIKLESLGFSQTQLTTVYQIISHPSGLVLITGPSGSGKTTLLYSLLNTLHKPHNNLITLEDPVELQMPDIRQVQINEAMGLSYAAAMRAVVRQDPDIIMLGEIRDADTAQMAFQAALIGILVLSTFHTLDVPGLVIRFIEMGIPRSVVAYALSGVITSRLLRRICHKCSDAYSLTDLEKKVMGEVNTTQTFRKGKGCEVCNRSGYLGRVGIFEVIPFDDEIRANIVGNLPATALLELLRERQIKRLRDCAIEKVLQGVTTVEEVIRVTGITA